jgi:hypothetical protein
LNIAGKVRRDGRTVTLKMERPGEEGADDKAIHDAVLIAVAFCRFIAMETSHRCRQSQKRTRQESGLQPGI